MTEASKATKPVDVALIGAGVMSATLGAMIKQLEPTWTIQVYEALGDVAQAVEVDVGPALDGDEVGP